MNAVRSPASSTVSAAATSAASSASRSTARRRNPVQTASAASAGVDLFVADGELRLDSLELRRPSARAGAAGAGTRSSRRRQTARGEPRLELVGGEEVVLVAERGRGGAKRLRRQRSGSVASRRSAGKPLPRLPLERAELSPQLGCDQHVLPGIGSPGHGEKRPARRQAERSSPSSARRKPSAASPPSRSRVPVASVSRASTSAAARASSAFLTSFGFGMTLSRTARIRWRKPPSGGFFFSTAPPTSPPTPSTGRGAAHACSRSVPAFAKRAPAAASRSTMSPPDSASASATSPRSKRSAGSSCPARRTRRASSACTPSTSA